MMTADIADMLGMAHRKLAQAQAQGHPSLAGPAVHLAYYAMFHAARAVLQQAHGTASTKHGGVHSALEALLKGEPDEIARYATALRVAYDMRIEEDYTTKSIPPEQAAQLVALAADFVAYCAQRLGAEPPPDPTANP